MPCASRGMRILGAGCGTGRQLATCQQRGPDIIVSIRRLSDCVAREAGSPSVDGRRSMALSRSRAIASETCNCLRSTASRVSGVETADGTNEMTSPPWSSPLQSLGRAHDGRATGRTAIARAPWLRRDSALGGFPLAQRFRRLIPFPCQMRCTLLTVLPMGDVVPLAFEPVKADRQ